MKKRATAQLPPTSCKHSERGQVLAIVVVLLVVVSIMVPVMVMYTQREAAWTAKQGANTTAFHMAEAGIEKGFMAISLSTLTWRNLQDGTLLTNYQFDRKFTDLSGGGFYAISITSGPDAEQATIIAIGRDPLGRETRALKAVYANATLGNTAIMGGNGVDQSGNNMEVEWGAVISPGPVTARAGVLHPQFWSADNVVNLDTNGSTAPNCDSPNCWFWHSYYANIPPMPTIDFNFYKSSAQSSGSGPCGAYYTNGSRTGDCADTTGNPYYVEGSWTNFGGSDIRGAVIVQGNFSTTNGSLGSNSRTVNVPRQAWKQYCNDWSYYLTNYNSDAWLSTTYPTSCPGLYSSYLSPSTMTATIAPVFQGLLYVGGDFTGPTGGGNTELIYGIVFVRGQVYLNSNSHVIVYYDSAVTQAIQTTQVILSRQSWQDVLRDWPSGL